MCSTATMRARAVILMLLSLEHSCLAGRPLLVFLIDGFRYDYMDDLNSLPGFRELVENGVKVDYMTPDFPSLSYPNYYSLMTGAPLSVACGATFINNQFSFLLCDRGFWLSNCAPLSVACGATFINNQFSFLLCDRGFWLSNCRNCEVHQMTGNYMWDEASMKDFLIGTNPDSRLPLWWDGSEPIWVTMQKTGKNVFMYYWPGCEVEILGKRPSFCEEYVYNPSEKQLMDSIEKSLDSLRSGNADMAAIYYEKIDVEGHHFGPDSHQVKVAVRELDTAMQALNKKIKEKNMADKLNVMLFSDHGMTKIQWMKKVIELDKYISTSDLVKMMDRGPVVSLWPKHNKFQEVYSALTQVTNMRVYERRDIPERFHYRGGKFVAPLTLVADPGWFIAENKANLPYWKNETGIASGWQNGWHGYDNEFIDMRAFFLATGPDFKKNVQAAPIRAVDVYNLMCRTTGVEPLPNNGSWSRVEYLLSGSNDQPRRAAFWRLWTSFLVMLLVLQG